MSLKEVFKIFRDMFVNNYVMVNGQLIPNRNYRFCGKEFHNDEHYLNSSYREMQRLIDHCNLTSNSKVIDLGCGTGRMPIGLIQKFSNLEYLGVDLNRSAIRWSKQNIEKHNPSFKFHHMDLLNPRYNPTGKQGHSKIRIPCNDKNADITYMYSVFSHLFVKEIEDILKEFYRILKDDGKMFLTAFVEENVEDISENPKGYNGVTWHGTLHCIRYEKKFFENIFKQHGFELYKFEHATETNGQSALYFRKT